MDKVEVSKVEVSKVEVSKVEVSKAEKDVDPKVSTRNIDAESIKTVSVGQLLFHRVDIEQAAQILQGWRESEEFRYVVTPNMDHMARLVGNQAGSILPIYQNADLLLCDSRILQKLIHSRLSETLPVVAGSDLTHYLFNQILLPSDRIVIVGGDNEVIGRVKEIFPRLSIAHINPSMGFIHKTQEVESLVEWIARRKPNFTFLAVGSPQQEQLAAALKASQCTGVSLCIGASIRFLVGDEVRAPILMQRLHLEWLFRMIQSPKRLIPRYFGNFTAIPKVAKFMKQSVAPLSKKNTKYDK